MSELVVDLTTQQIAARFPACVTQETRPGYQGFVVQVDTESYPELSGAIFAGTAIHPDGFKVERTPQ